MLRQNASTLGDARFQHALDKVRNARTRDRAVRELTDEEVVHALAAASEHHDPLLANVLATEAHNRITRLRSALSQLGEGVLTLSPEGVVLWANSMAESLLGRPRADMMGRDLHALIDHCDEDGASVPDGECGLMRAIEGVRKAAGEHFRRGDGSLLCVAYTAAPVRDASGDAVAVVVAFTDDAERRAHLRELEEARQRYASLFQHLRAGVVSVALDGTILETNPAVERMTGRGPQEAVGRPFADFLHPDDVEPMLALFAATARGEVKEARARVSHADGHFLDVEATGIPVLVRGEVVGVFGIFSPV